MNPFSEKKEGIALDRNRRSPAFAVALGGMLAALAVVIMCLGGLIPIATYVCPIVCSMLLAVMLKLCGRRFAWAWYAVVGILSSLFSPDKEGAAVFLFLGYYPILKPFLDRRRFRWLWKGLYFNGSIVLLYWLLLRLLGMGQLAEDFRDLGLAGLVLMLIMGNLVFFLLDRLLSGGFRRK